MAKDRTGKTPNAAANSTVNDETNEALKNEGAGATSETTDQPKAEGEGTGTGETPAPAKVSKKGQPVPIGKRRALGLAIRGLMAEVAAGTANAGTSGVEGVEDVPASPAYIAATEALGKNKYTELRPQAERLAEVQAKLQVAIAAGDGTTISKLGKELNRIKMGL